MPAIPSTTYYYEGDMLINQYKQSALPQDIA